MAERYGIEINRQKKALCIFHTEDTPSLSFKNNRFVCFGCGAKGSSIDIVMKLFNLEPIEAVKKISDDFSLGLDLKTDYTANMEQIQAHREDQAIVKSFQKWIDKTYSSYAILAKHYIENMKRYKPVLDDGTYHPKYVEAVHRLPTINFILDVLFEGSDQDKINLYKDLAIKGGEKAVDE